MKQDFLSLWPLAQGNMSQITCGAEFEMIALDNEKQIPLNRTMMTVGDRFVIDESLPVGYGNNGKYYNTVGLINYILRAHRAELKSSYHVVFHVPEPPSSDEAFLHIHILNLTGKKIGAIMPDGLSYMPEIVTSAGSVADVKRWSSLIRSLIEFAVAQIDGKIADKQLPYVLGNYDMIESISGIAAKKDAYYKMLIGSLSHYGKQIADLDAGGVRAMREEFCPGEECPMGLLQINACIGPQTVKKRGFSHNAATTSHHLHVSGATLKDTIDMFIAVMWYEGKTRCEYGTAYFEQLGKGYMRHVAFGSLIALRYRISRKSKAFLAEQGCSDHTNIPEHLQEALREQHLFMPELWVSSALSNGRDPVGSLACKIYKKVQETIDSGASWMIVEQEILHMIGKKFFADPDSFVESYVMGHETLKGGLRRSHSDIVLKTPVQLAPDQYILTIELRGQDYPPLTDFARDETRESYVIQNNLFLLQKSAAEFLAALKK